MAAAASPMSADMSGADADPTAMSPDASGDSSETLVTICKNADGTYTVYAGDEPDASADTGADDGESDDDDAAMDGQSAAPPMAPAGGDMSSGKQCSTIGAALKAALDILNEDKSSEGGEGSSEDQFQAGYGGDQSPTPMMGKK